MHLKRQKAPKKWPLTRKGTTFVVKPLSNLDKGIPVLVVLRDLLKTVQNRKEVKRAINFKNLLLNSRLLRDEREAMLLFDTLTIVPEKKSYRLELASSGKFTVNETKNPDKKISKIIDKKTIKGKKTQLNLSDGKNFISEIKCNVNDSALIDFKNKKIERCLPFTEKAKVVVFDGKHSGKKGIISKVDHENKMAEVRFENNTSNVLIKQVMVVE